MSMRGLGPFGGDVGVGVGGPRRVERAAEPPPRPCRRAADHRGGIVEQRREWREQRRIAAVPRGDATLRTKRLRPMRLTGEPLNTCRNAASSSASRSARRGAAVRRAGRRPDRARRARELVPRADREAVVAAVDAVADRGAKLDRDRPRVLDRQVRDAAARVELVRRGEGVRRARALAGVAADRRRRGPARSG